MPATVITTPAELQNMSVDLAGDYVLGNDIDMDGESWTPIGSESTPFTGKFDGAGYTISNLLLSKTTSGDEENYGFFGYVDGATIHDVIFEDCAIDLNITGGNLSNSGFLIGSAWNDISIYDITITNLTIDIDGVVTESLLGFGSLAGSGNISGSISNCKIDGEFSCDDVDLLAIGGFIGILGSTGSPTLSRCSVTINMVFDGCNSPLIIGGFIGWLSFEPGTVEHCFHSGTITMTDAIGDIASLGGLFGNLETTGELSNCYHNGNLTGNCSDDATGIALFSGLCASNANISNCYCNGNINMTSVDDQNGIGGMFGGLASSGIIDKTYCKGDITLSGNNIAGVSGYAAGAGSSLTLSNSFYRGNITVNVTGISQQIGGFFAVLAVAGDICDCYCAGTINFNSSVSYSRIGGFVGHLQDCDDGFITNCYSSVEIEHPNDPSVISVGGFIGEITEAAYLSNPGVMQNCSWRTDGAENAIGAIGIVSVETLQNISGGIDEDDYTRFFSKTHAVYGGN